MRCVFEPHNEAAQAHRRLLQTEAEFPTAGDEAQPLYLLRLVGPVATRRADRARQQADPFVVPDGFNVAAAGGRRFADLHA
jgi:hypothetical protein